MVPFGVEVCSQGHRDAHDWYHPTSDQRFSDSERTTIPWHKLLKLAGILDIACHGCWASGGAVNFSKLKVFSIRRQGGRLVYNPGSLDSMQGNLPFDTSGLSFVGIPLLMGEVPTARRRFCTHCSHMGFKCLQRACKPYPPPL